MSKRRRRKLKNIKIAEVSFVDSPANEMPFMFMKSADDPDCAPGFSMVDEELKMTVDQAADMIVGDAIEAAGAAD